MPSDQGNVVIPFSLRLFVFICALTIIFVLVFAIASQLHMGHRYERSNWPIISSALFILPCVIALSIAAEHRASRILIVLFTILLAHISIRWLNHNPEFVAATTRHASSIVLIMSAAVFWWLYGSRKIRMYFELITKSADQLNEKDVLETLRRGKTERYFLSISRYISPKLETIIAVVILLFGLIAIISAMPRTS